MAFGYGINWIVASDFRIGALISCLNFLACSFVLPPNLGGLYGGGGIRFSVSWDDADDDDSESEEILIGS